MLKPLKIEESFEDNDNEWLAAFWSDFRRRLVNLLGFDFRTFPPCK